MSTNRSVEPRAALIIIAVVVAVAALVGVTLNGDDGGRSITEDVADALPDPPDGLDEVDPSPVAGDERPEVPLIDCGPLLTLEEVDEALGSWERDPVPSTIQFSRGEACVDQFADDEAYFVAIAPGEPTDFLPGVPLNGVAPDPVEGLGDGAAWFGNEDQGVMAVWKATDLGALAFRVSLGRPDVDDATRRDLATTLAAAALPRFPGIEPPPPVDPVVLDIEPEPFDPAALGFDQNLLVKEEEGEWTRGEGLIATLEFFAGRRPVSEVLRHSDAVDRDGSGVIRLAQEYLTSGPDSDARATISDLLDELLLSSEDVEQLRSEATPQGTAPDEPPADDADQEAGGVTGGQIQLVLASVGSAQEGEECYQFFSSGCAQVIQIGDKFVLIAPPADETGWNQDAINFAIVAITEAAEAYEALGDLPDITFVLSEKPGPTWTDTSIPDLHDVHLNLDLKDLSLAEFQQAIAKQMAYSLLATNLDAVPAEGIEAWWLDGMALFLSSLVFDGADLELAALDTPGQYNAPLLARGPGTWLFFQYMWNKLTEAEFTEFLANLNELQDFEGIDEHWQAFNQAVSSGQILDPNGNPIPFPPAFFSDLQMISPEYLYATGLPPFGVFRLKVTTIGNSACVSFSGAGVTPSWRLEQSDVWHDSLSTLFLTPDSTHFLVLTATRPGASFNMRVKDDVSIEECENLASTPEPPPLTPLDPPGCDFDELCGPTGFFHLVKTFEDLLNLVIPD